MEREKEIATTGCAIVNTERTEDIEVKIPAHRHKCKALTALAV
jgi:hypothetical protein